MAKVKDYYSVPELAFELGKSRQQVSLDCRLGKIKCEKFGRSYFIHKDTVKQILKILGNNK